MTERRPFWLNLGKHGVSRMVCTSVQACLKFSHSLSRTIVLHVESERARRQPADGLNNRRRENEVEGKKRGERPGVIPLLVCFVIHRDIAESLLTEVSMILVGEKDSTRAWTIMCERSVAEGSPPLYRYRTGRHRSVSMYFQYRDKAI